MHAIYLTCIMSYWVAIYHVLTLPTEFTTSSVSNLHRPSLLLLDFFNTSHKLQLFIAMNLRTLAHIPPITIFEPFGLKHSLASSNSQYTLIKSDELVQIYKEIGRVQSYLHRLIQNMDGLSEAQTTEKAQPRPEGLKRPAAHRVPPEVLSLIFAQLVPPQVQKESDHLIFPKMAEILLPGRVCRQWKDAAIATPILWSSLSFDLDPRFTEVTEIGAIFLERAKNPSLSIQLRDARDGEPLHPIVPMLLTRAHQWYNLSADISFRMPRGS